MNNLTRHLKTILIVCLWAVIFPASLSSIYAFDNDRLDLTITRFLDALSYKYKGFDIKITEVSVKETFDDNITYANKNEKEDFITNARLGLGVNYEGKTRTFELTGDIGYQAFTKNSNFNNITQHINLNFKNEFSKRDRINLKNVLTHIEAPSSDEEGFTSQQFGRSRGRFEFFQNKFDINYSNDIAKQISLFVKYANEINIFPGSNRSNSFLNKPGMGLSYLFRPTKTIFLFSYDFTSVQFENDQDATIHTIGPGIRQYITKKLFLMGERG
ncbi:hypothetical protein [Candidatus Kuenenia stuttgartiensis]|uniref:hypothetical protein n=1 Tax=Kuenenia stuttgartiensis TaxID=174633 RepID=UPI00146DA0CC|nr:hypothetical protein [Candidatus Kuenenia stuttgartiensis]